MDKILLLGANGQVGWELRRSLLPLGELIALTREQCDVTNKDVLVSALRNFCPDIIVNAAAYTAVDKAETDAEMAMLVNAEAPAILADEARRSGALIVDYSTDYVFDGKKNSLYKETDVTNPLNMYGQSKLAGLQAIESSGCRYLVFRVSWVYGCRGQNFVKSIMDLARKKTVVKVVSDQIGTPTSADFIADVTANAVLQNQRGKISEGLFNLAPEGIVNRFKFAEIIFAHLARKAGSILPDLEPIKSDEFPLSARRPANSGLDTSKIKQEFGFYMPDWRFALTRFIEDLI